MQRNMIEPSLEKRTSILSCTIKKNNSLQRFMHEKYTFEYLVTDAANKTFPTLNGKPDRIIFTLTDQH